MYKVNDVFNTLKREIEKKMYKKHCVYIIILVYVLFDYLLYRLLVFKQSDIANVLSILTGFNITGLSVLLSSLNNKTELFKNDLHKPKQKEINIITRYYMFNIVLNIVTIFLLIFINFDYFSYHFIIYKKVIYSIIISVIFVSLYSFYLCFKILFVVFTKDRRY